MKAIRIFLLMLAALIALRTPAQADPSNFTPIWVDDSATLKDEDLQKAMDGLARQDANPQTVVVLIHGFATPRADSEKQYAIMAERAIAAYKKKDQRVAILGLQWDSDVGAPKMWLVKVVESTLGLGNDNPYLKKVLMSANVGRTAGRQVMHAIQQRFPNAYVDVYAHSLGCDVMRHVVNPYAKDHVKPMKGAPAPTTAFMPDVPLKFNTICLAGADLDFDLAYKTRHDTQAATPVGLFWLTIGGVKNLDHSDLVLVFRQFARGMRALGNRLPRLSRAQINQMCSQRRLVLDGNRIPADHAILTYYDAKRFDNVADAAVAIHDPSHPSKYLDQIDQIIKAPADVRALEKFFASLDLTMQYYTLWRLENLLCGQPEHLSTGYIEWEGQFLRDFPQHVDRDRQKSPCLVVREGYWPTRQMVTACIESLPGRDGRPKPPDDPYRMP